MRVGSPRLGRMGLSALAVLGAVLVLPGMPAFGQIPQPIIPDIVERSGLISRFDRIEPSLPPDPRRDTWYHTRWGDRPHGHRPNSIKEGGLYGHPMKANCTASIYPYFHGSPGKSSINCDCYPWPRPLRVFQSFAKPFKPVGMYYDQGSYVPIHDLDPIVPGPGPYPFPWYFNPARGG
ncbi:hypothetical protein [Singulisphaera acidiphila]|uniref:Uncharacterized protein n=1 Tax=Singulisphaera acidiphila (strain ATCC BAA-1392 / DSM 18658 / VKM B-2454 / MOB10) TaxID=886293 RepID=L0D6S3_SINAD|nr:hypothetical protein [Singulisphaera acidiphila]AGA25109.1 hypothetical protein Sinac_0697 [Singulisphaera acidiphila DSM 18658]